MRRRDFLAGLSASALLLSLRTPAASASLGAIAYVQEGNLWVRDLPAGRAKLLAAGPRIQSPRFSASGIWIAYDGSDALHVIRQDGSQAARLPLGAFAWHPVNDILAVANKDGLSLFRHSNGWNGSTLVGKKACRPLFSPRGTQIIYSEVMQEGRDTYGPIREGALYRVVLTAPGRQSQVLISKDRSDLVLASWTRDGKSVLYWRDPDFSASVAADGLTLFRIAVEGGSPQPLGVEMLPHRDWLSLSPTQNKMAVTAGSGRETWSHKRLAIVDLDTSALGCLTSNTTTAICPSWSPNGRLIAYVAAPEAPSWVGGGLEVKSFLDRRRIWVMRPSSAFRNKQITWDERYRDEKPVWSRDSAHILFCRMSSNANAALWLMGAGGENPVQVSGNLSLPSLLPPFQTGWFGDHGYFDWDRAFDWFRPQV